MRYVPSSKKGILIKGTYSINHKADIIDSYLIEDSFKIQIHLPTSFPEELPVVTDIGKKIPRTVNGDYHINPDDSLCLGATIRLQASTFNNQSLLNFCESFLDPYLYAVSHKIKYGGKLIFGELMHGNKGLIADYMTLFGLKTEKQVFTILYALSTHTRIANKLSCPCGCYNRLGACKFRLKLNKYRKIASRKWFREHYRDLLI